MKNPSFPTYNYDVATLSLCTCPLVLFLFSFISFVIILMIILILVTVIIVDRVFLTPLFYEDPPPPLPRPYIGYPFLIKICPTILSTFFLVSLADCVILANVIMNLDLLTIGTLVPEAPCRVVYAL